MRTEWPELPENDNGGQPRWLTFVSEMTGREYYYDTENKVATWILPKECGFEQTVDRATDVTDQTSKAHRHVTFQTIDNYHSVQTPIRRQLNKIQSDIRPVSQKLISYLMSSSFGWIMLGLNLIVGLSSFPLLHPLSFVDRGTSFLAIPRNQELVITNLDQKTSEMTQAAVQELQAQGFSRPPIAFTPDPQLPPTVESKHMIEEHVQMKEMVSKENISLCGDSTKQHQVETIEAMTEDMDEHTTRTPGDTTPVERSFYPHVVGSDRNKDNEKAGDESVDAKTRSHDAATPVDHDNAMPEDDQEATSYEKVEAGTRTDDSIGCLVPFAYLFSKKCRNLGKSRHPIQTDDLLNILME